MTPNRAATFPFPRFLPAAVLAFALAFLIPAAPARAQADRFFRPTEGFTRAKDLPDDVTAVVRSAQLEIKDAFEGSTVHSEAEAKLIEIGNKLHLETRSGTLRRRLLFREGDRAFLNFWRGTAEEALTDRFDQTFPEASVDLGVPAERFSKLANGVASRNFTKGRVLLNPTTSSQTVILGQTMRRMDGTEVTSVTLASGTAEILLSVTPAEGPPAPTNLRRDDVK